MPQRMAANLQVPTAANFVEFEVVHCTSMEILYNVWIAPGRNVSQRLFSVLPTTTNHHHCHRFGQSHDALFQEMRPSQ